VDEYGPGRRNRHGLVVPRLGRVHNPGGTVGRADYGATVRTIRDRLMETIHRRRGLSTGPSPP